MKTYAVLLLSIFYIASGCTKSATTKSPANNSEIGTLTVSANIVNKKIITGKDFEVKISATETITPWQDVSVQIDADNESVINFV